MLKRREDAVYLFAVNMRNRPTRGSFQFRDLPENAAAEVLGESRRISARKGEFADEFRPYAVHLYQIRGAK